MNTLRGLLFQIIIYGAMPFWGLLGLPFLIWSRAATYRVMKSYSHWAMWMARVLCGIRYEIRGEVPDGEVIIASKHQSFMDILLLMIALPAPKYVMKDSIKYLPALGQYAMRIGCAPIVRGKDGTKKMMEGVARHRRLPGQIIIYPQGTRVPVGEVRPYKRGVSHMYEALQLPLVPVATNAGVMGPKSGLAKYPGTAVIEFLEPLPAGLPAKELMEKLETRIETASDALL